MHWSQIPEFSYLYVFFLLWPIIDGYMGLSSLIPTPTFISPYFLNFCILYYFLVYHFITFVSKTFLYNFFIHFYFVLLILDSISWLLVLYTTYINSRPVLRPILFLASQLLIAAFSWLLTFSFHSVAIVKSSILCR